MKIGVPREIKSREYRVGMIPETVRELTSRGHDVVVETGCGAATGFPDADYEAAGAELVDTPEAVFEQAELIVKVKEPQESEARLLREGQTLFTFLHLAPDPDQARWLVDSGATCLAYETVTDDDGGLPLLAPMSEVAGRVAMQAGAHHLEKTQGGLGVLLGGVTGVEPARVVVIGGGTVGANAAQIAVGMGADVTIFDRSLPRLNELNGFFRGRARCLYSTSGKLDEAVVSADMVVGAVLIPGAATPKLVSRDQVRRMIAGSVLVDVAIDQGGCFETSRPTTHDEPTFRVDDVIHYCVANMPSAAARTATIALNNATLPFILALAQKGVDKALADDPNFRAGLNVHRGRITHPAVAEDLGYDYVAPEEFFDK
jgi:alanine dehydrogenase